MAHLDKSCETCDTQVEDNEQTFFAGYYKGIGLGVDSERKRVIELLEEMRDTCLRSGTSVGEHMASTLENAIALVKGKSE